MVQIKGIRIKDYKSMYDTGLITIEDRITVLAGKNESGKTNILHALETFYKDDFSKNDVPTKDGKLNPTIIVDFEVDGEYFNCKLKEDLLDAESTYTYTVERSKDYVDKFNGRIIDEVIKSITEREKPEIDKIKETFTEEILEKYNFQIDKINFNKEIIKIYKSFFSSEDLSEELSVFIKEIFKVEKLNEEMKTVSSEILQIVEQSDIYSMMKSVKKILIPEFKYFDNFNDMLPDEINLNEIENEEFTTKNRGFINLLGYFGKTLKEFQKEMNEVSRMPQTLLDSYSDNITFDYKNIYTQEDLRISLNKDGNMIYVNIYDVDDNIHPKKPSQRSKGLQWFLSFYLMLNNSQEDSILLIDEPGLYLHASAQKDILNFFENNLKNNIIYTTHSPYLIDTKNMLRIKLVINDRSKGKGTTVENKYYKCSDIDTITPLITAIGYDVSQSPLELGSGLNIITEGPSDRYYILSFIKLFGIEEDIHIIPAQGATTTHLLASLAIGWNLEYKVLLDTDSENEKARNKLYELYLNEDEYNKYIYKISKNKDFCIEDVFSKEDKKKYSIGKAKNKKLITAKMIYDKVVKGEIEKKDLEDETINNMEYILNLICNN